MTIPDQKDSLRSLEEDSTLGLPDLPEAHLRLVSEIPLEKKYSSLVIRSFKLCFKMIQKTFKRSAIFSGSTFKTLQVQKEKREIAMSEYITNVEAKMDLEEVRNRIKEQEVSGVKTEYEAKVRRLFDEGVCRVTLESPKADSKIDLKTATKSLTFSIDLYQYMALKLKESALGTNVDYMTITTTLEKQQMTHVMEFELKSAGQNWSTIFSKFIGKDVFHKIEWAGGLVDGHHMHNLTHIRDTFVFAFSHQRMELLEVISESKNHKVETNQEM
ncbi:MAG: hypothetical protein K2Q18_13875 [Bdellovibrionales bacterium]|nr:hypothetical protein [Bdellovibrionales bacterium]